MPELVSLSNIRYRPQTHTDTSPLSSVTLQVRALSPLRVKHSLFDSRGHFYAHQGLRLSPADSLPVTRK